MPDRIANKLLLIGWDAADWKVILPLIEKGQMPALERLMARGAHGTLTTLDPPLSPMLWTSIATGKTADQHGVLGFLEPTEAGDAVRPVMGTSRKAKAFWNILNQEGLTSNVIGWWPSHPAEPLRGVAVSNFYHHAGRPAYEPWPLPDGTVHPPELADTFAELRVHPQELTAAHILPFVPTAAEAAPAFPKQMSALASVLAHAASVQAAATWALAHTEWDLTAVYFDAIDHFGHGFMKYHPPHRAGVDAEAFRHFSGVVEAGYRFHDMMLERLVALAGDDATVIVISDHGFHSDHLRPLGLPQEPAAPALEHRDVGVVVAAGPGIARGSRIHGMGLLDVAPTVLALFGLPLGRDMAGAPALDAFAAPPELGYVDSWEGVAGDDGRHAAASRRDPWAEQEAMRQLEALGYIEPGSTTRVDKVVAESRFYLARALMDRGRVAEALPKLRALAADHPDAERYGLWLVSAYRQLQRFDEAQDALDAVADAHTARLTARRDALRARADALAAAVPASPEEAAARDRAVPRVAEALRRTERRLADPPAGVFYQFGVLRMAQGETERAIEAFRAAEAGLGHFPMLSLRLGEAYVLLKRWPEAEAQMRAALGADPDSAAAWRGLALALLRQGEPRAAADAALEAVSRRFFFPAAHVHLGEALALLGEHESAARAFELALSQNPAMSRVHGLLADLYRLHLHDPALATEHLKKYEAVGQP